MAGAVTVVRSDRAFLPGRSTGWTDARRHFASRPAVGLCYCSITVFGNAGEPRTAIHAGVLPGGDPLGGKVPIGKGSTSTQFLRFLASPRDADSTFKTCWIRNCKVSDQTLRVLFSCRSVALITA